MRAAVAIAGVVMLVVGLVSWFGSTLAAQSLTTQYLGRCSGLFPPAGCNTMLAPLVIYALIALIGIGLVIAGIAVTIVGAILEPKVPPTSQPSPAQPT